MKIVVLNGSPKGDVSVTMQYVNYLAKKYPLHEFHTVNISQRIKAIEKFPKEFEQIIADVRAAEGDHPGVQNGNPCIEKLLICEVHVQRAMLRERPHLVIVDIPRLIHGIGLPLCRCIPHVRLFLHMCFPQGRREQHQLLA